MLQNRLSFILNNKARGPGKWFKTLFEPQNAQKSSQFCHFFDIKSCSPVNSSTRKAEETPTFVV